MGIGAHKTYGGIGINKLPFLYRGNYRHYPQVHAHENI